MERSDHPSDDRLLGEIPIDKATIELDIEINKAYKAYSAELLRLALLTLTGLAIVWLRLYLPQDSKEIAAVRAPGVLSVSAFLSTAVGGASAVVQRFAAAETIA